MESMRVKRTREMKAQQTPYFSKRCCFVLRRMSQLDCEFGGMLGSFDLSLVRLIVPPREKEVIITLGTTSTTQIAASQAIVCFLPGTLWLMRGIKYRECFFSFSAKFSHRL